MKRKFSVTIFNQEEIKIITKFFPPVEMVAGTCVCYEGHIPQVAIMLTQGEIIITKRKSMVCELDKNEAYGLHHLINKKMLTYTATLKTNATVCVITHSSAMEIRETIDHPLYPIFHRVFELAQAAS